MKSDIAMDGARARRWRLWHRSAQALRTEARPSPTLLVLTDGESIRLTLATRGKGVMPVAD